MQAEATLASCWLEMFYFFCLASGFAWEGAS